MPHSYQPNDDRREIAKTDTRRADFGLPDHAVVFCCFNRSYKIRPDEFGIWMRVLLRIDRSVLWLYRTNTVAENNLRREAEARGVASERLIFANRVPAAEHLARHRHADLFLDTFNYNAHTTASDALWSGLPVVTKCGRQFSARVAASLLKAVNLSELIADTPEQYEAKILDLALNPEKLGAAKAHLATNRDRLPLFDTKRYARNFECGLQLAHERFRAGLQPADIVVSDVRSITP